MINFRYHVVTLVAVFLALGLGVLFGASFIDQKTVSGLQASQYRLGERNKTLRNEVVALQKGNESLQTFAASSRDLLIKDALRDRPMVLLAFASTDDALVRSAEDTLIKAGSRLQGSLRLSDDMDLRTDERRRRVASALAVAPADARRIGDHVAENMTAALSGASPGYVQTLIDAELASGRQPPGSQPRAPAELAEAGTGVVVLPPAGRDFSHRTFLFPLVRSLSAAAVPTAVAQPGASPTALIEAFRQSGSIRVVTIDGFEQAAGQAALALGLQAAYLGNFGHYGTGEGATAFLPAPESLAA